jgi:T4 RnlA family RNA ligase
MDESMDQLYQNLTSLCSKNTSFYYKDQELNSIQYRIFNYRLCSYEQFHKYPSALNCRGTMFNISDPQNIQLVCLPPEKFFNYEEGSSLQNHSLGKLGVQMDKLDGSLISTYLHDQQSVRLKSKASLTSDQALQANSLLSGLFRNEIEQIVHLNYTVNFEYTSPTNQVVVYYPQPKLSVLSIRFHLTGETFFGDELILFLKKNNWLTVVENVVSFKNISNELNQKELIENIRKEVGGEGYVIEIIRPDHTSYLVKVKTTAYLSLHHTRFSLDSARYLCQCIIDEQSDDLRSLFRNNPSALERIDNFEKKIRPIFNGMVQSIELFYEENKHLSRKDYAIRLTNTPNMKVYMPVCMNLYVGKENDYKKFAMNHLKDIFHIDEQINTDETTNNDEDQ